MVSIDKASGSVKKAWRRCQLWLFTRKIWLYTVWMLIWISYVESQLVQSSKLNPRSNQSQSIYLPFLAKCLLFIITHNIITFLQWFSSSNCNQVLLFGLWLFFWLSNYELLIPWDFSVFPLQYPLNPAPRKSPNRHLC